MTRSLVSLLVLVAASPAFAQPADVTDAYGKLLAKYVTPNGVKYDAWRAEKADVDALSAIVTKMTAQPFKTMPEKERYAAFINLYNAKVLETVLTGNPKESIKDLSNGKLGFEIFYREMIDVEGTKVSLNQLEERLRMESKDPRVHFAVNCASISCPPIASEPYAAPKLDAQLDTMTKAFLARPDAIKMTESGAKMTLEVSKIFDWYSKDFEWKGGAVAFIGQYGPESVAAKAKAPDTKVKLDYQDYNWNLNKAM